MYEKIYKGMKTISAIILAIIILIMVFDINLAWQTLELIMKAFGLSFSITLIMYGIRNWIGKKCPHKHK